MPGQAQYSIGLVLGGGRTPRAASAHSAASAQGDDRPSAATPTRCARRPASTSRSARRSPPTGSTYTLAERPGPLGLSARHRQADGHDDRGHRTSALARARSRRSDRDELDEEQELARRGRARVLGRPANVAAAEGKSRGTSRCSRSSDYNGHRWGMAIDLVDVHRLQRVHGRVSVGEQRPGRRPQGGHATTARCTGSGSTATSSGTPGRAARRAPAAAVPAVRERAVRAGLPGRRDQRTATKA